MTKLLDISFWQGSFDFTKLKQAGYNHIILRAGYGTTKDSKFDEYAKGCQKAGINIVGVYWFIYATNISEVQANAKKCLEIIKPYNIPIVFADFEYDTITKAKQKGVSLGSKECNSFTNTFCEAIKKAGYIPGYYANTDYYKNMYTSEVKNKGYVFWLAEYKSNHAYHEPSIPCDFFQYTDRGTVSTIPGKTFDTNVCFSEKYLNISSSNNSSSTSNNSQGGNTMSNNIIQKIINDAVDYAVGIANDNSHGYSQAVRSLYNVTSPKSFDCSSLVLTSYYYAFVKNGLSKQAQYLKGNCSYTGNMMKMLNCGFEVVATNQTAHSKMQKGDIELNITYHTAMAINKDRIVHARSSEGTSDTKDNSGNEIRVQGWYLYSHGWDKRLRFTGKGIDFSNISSAPSSPTSTPSKPTVSTGNQLIKDAQTHLNNFINARLVCDGIYGTATKKAFIKALQLSLNKDMKLNLSVDGILGTNTKKALKSVILKNKSKGYIVTILEIGMLLNNINPNGVECPGIMGHGLVSAVKQYQKNKGLVQDGIVGINTWKSLCK